MAPFFRQSFVRSGNPPDLGALAATIRPTISDPFYISARPGFVDIEKPTAWSGGDVTTVQAAVTAAVDATADTDAQNAIDQMSVFQKAIILAIIDQLNVLRADITTLGISRAAITPAQAVAAVRAKAGTL